MKQRIAGSSVTATAACVARAGVDGDGVVVPAAEVVDRVGWLVSLSNRIAGGIVAERWTRTDLGTLATGVGPDGRGLPSNGFMAARRLGWAQPALVGTYVPDRVARCGQEHAVRLLRAGVHRAKLTGVLIESWPVDSNRRTRAEWDALEIAAQAAGVEWSKPEVRNRTRAIAAFEKTYGRLPAHVTELEAPPRVAAEIVRSCQVDCVSSHAFLI